MDQSPEGPHSSSPHSGESVQLSPPIVCNLHLPLTAVAIIGQPRPILQLSAVELIVVPAYSSSRFSVFRGP